jgi:hypothetical protein
MRRGGRGATALTRWLEKRSSFSSIRSFRKCGERGGMRLAARYSGGATACGLVGALHGTLCHWWLRPRISGSCRHGSGRYACSAPRGCSAARTAVSTAIKPAWRCRSLKSVSAGIVGESAASPMAVCAVNKLEGFRSTKSLPSPSLADPNAGMARHPPTARAAWRERVTPGLPGVAWSSSAHTTMRAFGYASRIDRATGPDCPRGRPLQPRGRWPPTPWHRWRSLR